MMMMPPSSPTSPPQSTKNSRSTTAQKVNGSKTRTSNKVKVGKKGYTPKKYPKPTLAELALLVGNEKKISSKALAAEKPVPYELKWRENGAELCLFSANQTFIAAQMLRVQTHTVQPMPAPVIKSLLAVVVEEKKTILPVEVSLFEEVEISLSVKNKETEVAEPPLEQLATIEDSTSQLLSTFLGIQPADNTLDNSETWLPIQPEEDPCPTSIELEFETPIEAKIADFLGVKHSSKITISVTEKSTALVSNPISADTALLPIIEDCFSEALETELALQKAWLESALEREKQKAYPKNTACLIPTAETKEEEEASVLANEGVELETILSAEKTAEAENPITPNEISENTIGDNVFSVETEANEKDFAAVLDSLMEDFSTADEVVLVEEQQQQPLLQPSPAEINNTIDDEAVNSFEVIGLLANQQPLAETELQAEQNFLEEAVTLPPITTTTPLTHSNPFAEITTLTQLLKITRPETPMDFLLLGAYFLKQQEQKEVFSLRQLNHLLSSASKPNANHTVLELALAKHFITMVPDLTGTAKSTEYQLSKAGDSAALRLFQTAPIG